MFAGIERGGDVAGAGGLVAQEGVGQSGFAHAALSEQDVGMPLQDGAQDVGVFQRTGFDDGITERFVEFEFFAPEGGFRQVGFVQDDDGLDAGGFGGKEGALQQGFAGRGNGGGHDKELGNIGGDELGFPSVLAVEQAFAREIVFDDGLFGVDVLDMHAVAAGEIHPLFARAGFVGFAVGRSHDVAAAVAGNDLGGIGHKWLGRVEWIKGLFAAAWLPCGEKVLYRNRQGSSETIL